MASDPNNRKHTLRASQASLSVRKRAARARAEKPADGSVNHPPVPLPVQPVIAPESAAEAPVPQSGLGEVHPAQESPSGEPLEASHSPSEALEATPQTHTTPEASEPSETLRADPVVASNWTAVADSENQTVTIQLQDENLNPISVIHLDAETWNQMADTFKGQLTPGYNPEAIKQASTYRLRVPESVEGDAPDPLLTLIHADGTVLGTLPITEPVVKHLGKVFDRLRPKKDRINFKKEMLEHPKRTAFFVATFLLVVVLPVGWGLVTYFTTLFTS